MLVDDGNPLDSPYDTRLSQKEDVKDRSFTGLAGQETRRTSLGGPQVRRIGGDNDAATGRIANLDFHASVAAKFFALGLAGDVDDLAADATIATEK